MSFIGIDVHKGKLTIAHIDEAMNVLCVKNLSIDEFINYMKSTQVMVIAVDAPYKLNSGLMNKEDYRKSLNPELKGHYNKKVSEYELSKRGINPFSTPMNMEEITGWKEWMNTGFNLYNALERIAYKEINTTNYLDNANGFIEVFPHGCFATLLDRIQAPKDTLEGLHERMDILEKVGFQNIDKILDGSGKHEKTDKLDALIAAYTAFLTKKGSVTFVGDTKEGQICLPVAFLKDSYKRMARKQNIEQIPLISSTIKFELEKYQYEFFNSDSVLWLKHFKPLNDSPEIKSILKMDENTRVYAVIHKEGMKSIEVLLEPLKNRSDGLKVSNDSKAKLKQFWNVSGDKKKYIITIKV